MVQLSTLVRGPLTERSSEGRQKLERQSDNISKDQATDKEKLPRTRITISLSCKSVKYFQELKSLTDADTDSEVFRNAIRLHLSLLRTQISGKEILIRKSPEAEPVALQLFAQEEIDT